jgi:cytoskeletal protein CcmA (bactofilin family)
MRKLFRAFATVLVVAAVCSCGGGGGSMFTTANSEPVSTMGTITAFGSVVINGVHFDINSATLTRNGVAVTQSDLAVGQIARVHGRKNMHDHNGRANHVDVDDQVVGPITSIDMAAGSFVALGQTVTVDSGTSFKRDLAGVSALAVGDVVEVSGLVAADGHIAATRIERENGATNFQVIGTVANLDSTANTFSINALTVDYSTAMLNDFTSGAPADGDVVEAKGSAFDTATTTLTAMRVEPADDETRDADDGDEIEREGLITRFVSATDFDVAGKPVTTSTSTTFEGGTAADLALNVRVEAEGSLDANNVLVADKIEIKKAGIAELRGNITAVDATAGTVMLLGVTVTVTADTRLEDKSDADIEHFSLSDLAVGDTVEVRGFENPIGSGAITATRLERERPRTTVVVGGFFQAGVVPQFSILGIAIDATNAEITKDFHTSLTLDEFFAQAPGHVVFVRGTLNGTTVVADRIRLAIREDCEDEDEDED